MRSHTSQICTLGKGYIIRESTKQKVNTSNSTEAELVAVDDKISKIIWMKIFIEEQGFKNTSNILYQDNKSTIQLQNNGKESSGKRTRLFDMKCFYVTDLIKRRELEVKFCPNDKMTANYMTKPLTGNFFLNRNNIIQN